jgi:creatinine amidohydrolase
MPVIPFSYETYHMDFHGTIEIQIEHLLRFMLDMTKSVGHHGFPAFLSPTDTAPICQSLSWWRAGRSSKPKLFARPSSGLPLPLIEIRQLRQPGRSGMSHACELETSIYLCLDAERVQKDKTRK